MSIIPESPLESSSVAASAIDAVEDPAFTNFFSVRNVVACQFSMPFGQYFCNVYIDLHFLLYDVCGFRIFLIQLLQTLKVTGNYASSMENFRQHSATVTSAPGGLLSTAPTVQIPSASHSTSSISGFPLDSLETAKSGNQVINLVKPSTFFASTSSSSLLVPPIYSSVPPSAVVHHSLNVPRQYGTPVLQPFPPPNPPLSLTPISSSTPNRPVISRDNVRDALLSLVQVFHDFAIFVLVPLCVLTIINLIVFLSCHSITFSLGVGWVKIKGDLPHGRKSSLTHSYYIVNEYLAITLEVCHLIIYPNY